MGYLRKYLQQVGLVSTLLFVGAMGGLMAPLSSQAGTPSLTVLIDGQPLRTSTGGIVPNSSILGAKLSACSTADRGLGYTDCYAILTSTTVAYQTAITAANPTVRLYRIQNATGATARLRVGDNLGQDYFSLVGVQFVPVNTPTQAATVVTNWDNSPAANTNEAHILTIAMRNKFDAAVNVGNATGVVVGSTTIGQVAFGIASGGEFRSAPLSTPVPTTTLFCTTGTAAARCSTVGDNVTFTGTGIFSGTTSVDILSPAPAVNNSRPLSLTVGAGNANNSIVGYAGLDNATLGQVNPEYPKFDCKDPNALPVNTKCQPDITLTMTATLKGPDTFVLLNGANGSCAICNFAQNDNRLTQLFTLLSQVIAFLDWWENTHTNNQPLRDFITNAQAFLVGFNGPPADPDCAGSKSVQSSLLFESLKNQVTIAGDGGAQVDPAPATGTITITKNTSQATSATFDFEITGPSSSTASISMVGQNSKTTVVTVNAGTYSIAESPTSGWTLNNVSCGENGDTVSDGVVGVQVPLGANVTCTFNNNKALSGDNYQKIDASGISWTAARAAALLLSPPGSWDLATITSQAEQEFIQTLLPAPTSHTQYWIGGEQVGGVEPGGNWRWINGEGMFWNNGEIDGQYHNWGADGSNPPEPNDCCGIPGVEDGEQNHLALDSRYPVANPAYGWDDNDNFSTVIRGYVAERVSP